MATRPPTRPHHCERCQARPATVTVEWTVRVWNAWDDEPGTPVFVSRRLCDECAALEAANYERCGARTRSIA